MSAAADQPIYHERYVAFIDILGFSSIVANSVVSPAQAEKLVAILERISQRTQRRLIDAALGDDFKAQSFSDCIVISEAASQIGLGHLLYVVTQLALDLLATGILIRGGIAKGGLHHTDKIVFGPALVAAYQLENTIALYPRIVVDRSTHQDFLLIDQPDRLSDDASGLEGRLRYDDDGPVFVDIFAPFRDLTGTPPAHLLAAAAKCRVSIQNHLNESIYDPRIYKKLRWLAIYWNGAVMERVRQRIEIEGMERVDFPAMANLK